MSITKSQCRNQPDATHLTLENRKVIEAGITNGSDKASIARTIGKDATTVAKEIRKHRILVPRNTFNRPVLCEYRQNCPNKPCTKKCQNYMEPRCNRRDRSPGACNGCKNSKTCIYDRYTYNAAKADEAYRKELADSRAGISLTQQERELFGKTIAPLLRHGQSIHQIMSSHPEITISERTMYTYIETGVFQEYGVSRFSLKEQVNRKQCARKLKKRKEPVNYEGRRYADFMTFCLENPETPVTEMDTVYNHPEGPYLQTFLIGRTDFIVCILHQEKTSEAMACGLTGHQEALGADMFSRLFALLLTDRGVEFEKWKLFECNADGSTRCRIFYCDPMQSNQKPHIENAHNYVRDIIPNGWSMGGLTQEDINLMCSHINSTPRRALNDKTPYELFSFFYGEKTAELLGIEKIRRDEVILKPELIFPNKH